MWHHIRQQTSGENDEYSAVLTTGKEDANEQHHYSGTRASIAVTATVAKASHSVKDARHCISMLS